MLKNKEAEEKTQEEIKEEQKQEKIKEVLEVLKKDNVYTKDLPDEVYYSLEGFLSSTSLKKLLISPQHFKNPKAYGNSPANRHLHQALLEKEKFNNLTVIGDLRKAENKELLKSTKDEGKDFIKEIDFKKILPVNTAFSENIDFQYLIKDFEKEKSFLCIDEQFHHVKFRAKADLINHDKKVIMDLKNMGSPINGLSNQECYRRAKQQGWFFQASLYLYILKTITKQDYEFKFLFIEDKSPFLYRVVSFQDSLKEMYDEKLMNAIVTLHNCFDENYFRGYSEIDCGFDVPEWDMA